MRYFLRSKEKDESCGKGLLCTIAARRRKWRCRGGGRGVIAKAVISTCPALKQENAGASAADSSGKSIFISDDLCYVCGSRERNLLTL